MLEQIQFDELKQLYAYWNSKRKGRVAPTPDDIDPTEITHLLPYVMLLDVEENPRRYKFRLAGTAIVERFGAEQTGCYLDEVDFGARSKRIIELMHELVETSVATCARGTYEKGDGRVLRFERLAMPLSADGRHVSRILVGLIYEPLSDQGIRWPGHTASIDLHKDTAGQKETPPDKTGLP